MPGPTRGRDISIGRLYIFWATGIFIGTYAIGVYLKITTVTPFTYTFSPVGNYYDRRIYEDYNNWKWFYMPVVINICTVIARSVALTTDCTYAVR